MGPTLPTHLAGQIQFRLTWTKMGIPTGLPHTDSKEEHYSGSLVMFEAHRARSVPLTLQEAARSQERVPAWISLKSRDLLLPEHIAAGASSGQRRQAAVLKPFTHLRTGGLQKAALQPSLSHFLPSYLQFLWLQGKPGQTKEILATWVNSPATSVMITPPVKISRSDLLLSCECILYIWCMILPRMHSYVRSLEHICLVTKSSYVDPL